MERFHWLTKNKEQSNCALVLWGRKSCSNSLQEVCGIQSHR